MNEPYSIELSTKAEADLKRLPKELRTRIGKKLQEMAVDVRGFRHHALTGNLSGFYRVRVSNYRILYELQHQNQLIYVVRIRHRREVYD